MAAPASIKDRVSRVLKDEARKGECTKETVVLLAMNASRGQGDFGLSRSELLMSARAIYSREVDRQLKQGLPDNLIHDAMRNARLPDLVQILKRLPAWIAVSEGREAKWIPALRATPEQWLANYELKQRKSDQTQTRADESREIVDYLIRYGMHSLEDALPMDVVA